jgi:ABC-type multidrug transport system fused ATPase/permease subunit
MFHFYDLHAAFEAAKTQSFTSITSDTSSCHSAPASDKTPIVEFANVSFSYPNTTPQFYGNSMPVVLSDVSFSVQRQSLTAIMGASGSGKSSIGKLLLQFYSPSSGAVYLNSSVCKVPDSAFKMREIVSWVDQVRNAKLIACVITPESDVCRAVVF